MSKVIRLQPKYTLFSVCRHLLLSSILFSPGLIVSASEKSSGSPSLLTSLSLQQAVQLAQQNDPWLVGNRFSQMATESLSVAADTLPDPQVSIGLANIAADSFDFNQEAMSQFKIGVSQMLPRGDSLSLKKQQLNLLSQQFPYQREDRLAKIEVLVSHLWMDAFKAQQSIKLIDNNRALFEQLADVAQASYSSALGKTRQQDIIRSQLELTRIEDRLLMLQQSRQMAMQKLSQWTRADFVEPRSSNKDFSQSEFALDEIRLSEQLPQINLLEPVLYQTKANSNQIDFFRHFETHPSVMAVDQQIKASGTEVEIARQSYKPEWGINAGYAYRDNDPQGNGRADLFSVGVTFDLPLFTGNKQDQQVKSAVAKSSAIKTEKWLLLRNLMASFESEKAQLARLTDRLELYQLRLLPQMHDQAEAALTAYTNDDGDFSEVVRARISELNAAIETLNIQVDRQKTIVQLNYFFKKTSLKNEFEEKSLGE